MKTNNNLIFIGEFQPCNEKYYNPLHGDCITDSIILQNNITYKSSVTKYITGHVINDKIIINTDYVNTDNNVSLLLSCNNSNSTVTNDTCTTTTTTTSSTGITSRRMMMIKHETQISFISKPWQYIHDNNWNKVTCQDKSDINRSNSSNSNIRSSSNFSSSSSRSSNSSSSNSNNIISHCFVISVLLPHYNDDGNYRLKVISQFKSTSFQINCQNRNIKNYKLNESIHSIAPMKDNYINNNNYEVVTSSSSELCVNHSEIINISDGDDDLYQQNLLISILQNMQYKKYEEYEDNNNDLDNDDNNSATTITSDSTIVSQLSMKRHLTCISSCKSSPLADRVVADEDDEETEETFYEPFFKYIKK